MSYDRLIQWIAGPSSAVVGFLTMKLANAPILGSLHLGKAAVSHAIVDVITFAGGAIATYAAHHKWLTNLARWWRASGLTFPAVATAAEPPPEVNPESGAAPDAER